MMTSGETLLGGAAGSRDRYRKIATEEAFAIPEWLDAMAQVPMEGGEAAEVRFLRFVQAVEEWRVGLVDFDRRLAIMDEHGVDMHLLSLTTPGVQSFAPDHASEVATMVNDKLAEIIARHPDRFSGLATVAPQQPEAAARELERAITKLGLNGLLINSYTNDEYLDLEKFDPIIAMAAKLDTPLYLHPRTPSPSMVKPYAAHGLIGALWGFAADTGLHAMRLVMSGVFDRHPNLTVVLGHLGEGIPYWFWRIDNMYKKFNRLGAGRAIGIRPLRQLPSEYFKTNIYLTTSGMNSYDTLAFAIDQVGADRIMFAVDFPYESTEESVHFLDTAPISMENRNAIAHGNAERVFKIEPL